MRLAPNSSLLFDFRSRDDSDFEVLGRDKVYEMRQRYSDLIRDYELRRNHGLTDAGDERVQLDRMRGFAREMVNNVRSYQVTKESKKLRKRAEQSDGLEFAKKPIAAAAAIAAVSTGQPLEVRVDEQTRITTKTSIPDQRGKVSWRSPYLNGAFEFVAAAPALRDPYAPPPVDPTQREERYRFSLSRELPVLDLEGGVSYGTTTTTLTASLSRKLMAHLTAVVDSTRNLNYMGQNATNGEESLKFFYGIRF